MIQHFTLTANVHKGAMSDATTYILMAVCEERNEKWASGPLNAAELHKALGGSQLSLKQIEEPILSANQVTFKAPDGKNMLFLEDELKKMNLQRIANR